MILPSAEVIRITTDLLDKYKFDDKIEDAFKPGYKYQQPEEFLTDFFTFNNYHEDVQDTVMELFFRILKFRTFLNLILKEGLMNMPTDPKNPKEFSTNLVLLYLLVIELNQNTKNKIYEIVTCIDEKKSHYILNTFKNSENMGKLFEWACRFWDVEYVGKILENVAQKPLFEELFDRISSCASIIKTSKEKTPRKIKVPKCSMQGKKKVPVHLDPSLASDSISENLAHNKPTKPPPTTYKRPKQQKQLREERIKNRLKAEQLLEEANKNAFNASKVEKSKKYKETIEKYEKEKFEAPRIKSFVPKIKIKEEPPPKKTVAVILREGARLLKREEEEIKKYEYLASGGFNDDWLVEWEEQMREEEYRKNVEDIEKKHLEGLLSREEALIAKQKFCQKKKESIEKFKKEKESWLHQLENVKNEQRLKILEAVEKGKAVGKGLKDKMDRIKEEKHKSALELAEESRLLKEKWMKEKEEELQKKIQIIKEIKALQAIGEVRIKHVDLTETANLGLLYEMSIAELKERLFIVKMEMEEEIEKKRAEIRIKKECRKVIVKSYQDLIESHQKILEEQKKNSLSKEKKEIKVNKKPKESQSLEHLRRKLYEKRRERVKLQVLAEC